MHDFFSSFPPFGDPDARSLKPPHLDFLSLNPSSIVSFSPSPLLARDQTIETCPVGLSFCDKRTVSLLQRGVREEPPLPCCALAKEPPARLRKCSTSPSPPPQKNPSKGTPPPPPPPPPSAPSIDPLFFPSFSAIRLDRTRPSPLPPPFPSAQELTKALFLFFSKQKKGT